MPISLGQTIDSRYILFRYVASGAMADIYEAQDIILSKPVALKFLKEKFLESPDSVEQFKNEARFASIFSHVNIMKIYNVGEYQSRPYISYELLKGKTLKEILDSRGNLSFDESLDYMLQILNAMQVVHSLGVSHNDLKPDNLFLQIDGNIKICDFGIASHISSREEKHILGTPNYLAPEVISSKKYSVQSDIYSLGIVFYELLTGELPFEGESSKEVLEAHAKGASVSVASRLLNKYSKDIDYVINKAIDSSISSRYKSDKEFINDLIKIKKGESLQKESFIKRMFK